MVFVQKPNQIGNSETVKAMYYCITMYGQNSTAAMIKVATTKNILQAICNIKVFIFLHCHAVGTVPCHRPV